MQVFKLKLGKYQYNLLEKELADELGKKIIIRHQSWQVLHYLALNYNKIITKKELFANIWKNISVTDDSLVQCIAEIRRFLEDDNHQIIKTIPRRGYVLIPSENNEPNGYIPEDIVPFLGRTKELEELTNLLLRAECRLLTIVGLGGVGKSRLAKQLAKKVSFYFSQGVFFIELAAIQQPNLIISTIATTMRVPIQGRYSAIEQLKLSLGNKKALLILDNVEHLLEDILIAQELLEFNKNLKIVMTSRLPSKLYGEWIYLLKGFENKINNEGAVNTALDLFIKTAQRVKNDFFASSNECKIIYQICNLVDNMPLGIEMAASWAKYLSCQEILTEMQNFLAQSYCASITEETDTSKLSTLLNQNWSLLSKHEQRILQSLALFSGKFSTKASYAVSDAQFIDHCSLIDKSILHRNSDGTYQLHEVVRHYANHYRLIHDEEKVITKNFINYYLELAQSLDKEILSQHQLARVQQLEQDHNHFRSCLKLCLDNKRQFYDQGLTLIGELGTFWFLASHWQEGAQWAKHFISLVPRPYSSLTYAKALFTIGGLGVVLDNHKDAEKSLLASIEIVSKVNHKVYLARGLTALGVLRRLQNNYLESIHCGQQSMVIFAESHDTAGYQFNLANVGHSRLCLNHYDEGIKVLEECIYLNQSSSITLSLPYALVNLGKVHAKFQQFSYARDYLHRAIKASDQLGILLYRAQALCLLGWLDILESNMIQALLWLKASLADYLRLGDREGQIEVLYGISLIKLSFNDLKVAYQLMVLATDIKQRSGLKNSSDYEELIIKAKSQLNTSLTPNELNIYRNLARSFDLNSLLDMV